MKNVLFLHLMQKKTLYALYKMDNAACDRTAFAFGTYTNDREYWRKILEASAM